MTEVPKHERRLSQKLEAEVLQLGPKVEVSRLVARIHTEIQCWDRFLDFCMVFVAVLAFLIFIATIGYPQTRPALEAVREWVPLEVNEAGGVNVQIDALPEVLGTLAQHAQKVTPESVVYHDAQARLLVGKPTVFTGWHQLKEPRVEFNTAFSFTAWVKERVSGARPSIIRKVRAAKSGKLVDDSDFAECWGFHAEPLRFRYATPLDTVHAEWAYQHGYDNIQRRAGLNQVMFEASRDYFKHGEKNASVAQELAQSMRLARDSDGKFHLVAMVYEYDVVAQNARVRFGFDGRPLEEALGPSGKQPFPAMDCELDATVLLGSYEIEIADLLWFPHALSDEEFSGLYAGNLRSMLATSSAEEVRPAQDWVAMVEQRSQQYHEKEKENEKEHRKWVEQKSTSGAGTDRRFVMQDHSCSSVLCEVRVHPMGDWYRVLNHSQTILRLKSDVATCSDASGTLAQSVGQPVTSVRPVTAPNALLDRFTVDVSMLQARSRMLMCWQESLTEGALVLPVGMLHLTHVVGDYKELISDASLTFKEGHSIVPVTMAVGRAPVTTITFWCHLNTISAPNHAPWVFMKTLTGTADIIIDNALWGVYASTVWGGLFWWKDVHGDGTAFVEYLRRASCSPQPDTSKYMTHVAYVHDASEHTASLFVDGEICASLSANLDHGQDASKIFDDGPGNITVAAGLGGNYEFTGELRQFRYYQRKLSPAEIKNLASSDMHSICQRLENIRDDPSWKDGAGKTCYDYFVYDEKGGCTKAAKQKCPIACSSVPKCYRSSNNLPKSQYLFPRQPWTNTHRLCLVNRKSAKHLLDRCSGLTLADRKKEKQGSAPWAFSNTEVEDSNLMCRQLSQTLGGSDSCPLNLTDFQQRWQSGDDWTLMWYGYSLSAYCSLLAPTSVVLSVSSLARFYTNASTGAHELITAGTYRGWSALSVSKTRGKVVYQRDKWGNELDFTDLDPCPIEAFGFYKLKNLRFIPKFFSLGELTQLYYRETAILNFGYEFKPAQADRDQFSMESSDFFQPFELPMWNVMPPVIFAGQDSADGQQCTNMAEAAFRTAVSNRAMHRACQDGSYDGCKDNAGVLSSHCLSSSYVDDDNLRNDAIGAAVQFQSRHGKAFDLELFEQVVIPVNGDLQPPFEILGRHIRHISVLFILWVQPKTAVLIHVKLDKDTLLAQGKAYISAFSDPGPGFLPSGALSVALATCVIATFAFKFVQRKRRLAVVRRLLKLGISGSKPTKNLQHLKVDGSYCPDPIARLPMELETAIFSTAAVALSAGTVVFTIIHITDLRHTLLTDVLEGKAGNLPLTDRFQLIDKIATGMSSIQFVKTLSLLSGIAVCLSFLSLSGFHLRTAIVIRSLKGSVDPLLHFFLIFFSTGVLVSLLIYIILSAEHDGYALPGDAVNTQVDFIMGAERPHTNAGDSSVNSITHSFVIVFFTLVLINIFLAIVLQAHQKESERVEDIVVEYSLAYDAWLTLTSCCRFRWSNRKLWALAHILCTTGSDKGFMESEADFLDLVGEQHLQVVVRGGTMEFDDPVYGRYHFSEHELRAYFRQMKTMDVLWPDDDHGDAASEAIDDACGSHHVGKVPEVAEADFFDFEDEQMVERPLHAEGPTVTRGPYIGQTRGDVCYADL